MLRILTRVAAAIVILAATAAIGGYVYLRRSLPALSGIATVSGIHGVVEIVRDADAIPHVFASTKADALFGLGYVHAQDRLWQMEFQRRIGFGRLSEIFGTATIPQDRFLRTVGFGRAARAAWKQTPAWAKDQINAYIAGVNAFISTHHGSALPPEFSLLRFEPEPWSGPDVAVWVKMMAWDLSANYSFELLRDDLVRDVGVERMADLMPPYPVNGLSIVPGALGESGEPSRSGGSRGSGGSGASASYSFASALSLGDPVVAEFLLGNSRSEALGSNNWVVDSTMTASGKRCSRQRPAFERGTYRPGTPRRRRRLRRDRRDALPAAGDLRSGRNKFVAWGETNVAADVEDLFRERLDPTGKFAEYRGAQEPVREIPETIVVKGAPSVQVNVRVTRHGPIVSDAINAINEASPKTPKPAVLDPLAFRWTALDDDDTTLQAFLKVNDARNWNDFSGALREFVSPSQNFVYADVDGHIGYYAPGRIPIRASGDGARPAEGWTGAGEWTGWVPFDALPHIYDPPSHFIVTANHRPEPSDYPYLLGLEWVEPYRAQRILDLLGGRSKLTTQDFAAIQADTVSLHARTLLPVLLAHVRPDSQASRDAVKVLSQWDGDAKGDLAAPAIFAAWFHELAAAIAGDELGPRTLDSYASRFTFITRFVTRTLTANDSRWCDDVRSPKRETCDDVVTAALDAGLARVATRLGGNQAQWRWDAIHPAMFPHQGLDSVRLLRRFLSRSVPNGGDWSTVDVGPVAADELFEQHSVPGYRQVVDLSPANDSRFLDAVGQSGHFLSPHYDDFLADWRAVKHRKMRMQRAEVNNGAIGHLTLTPQ
jgi:penicillin amidase